MKVAPEVRKTHRKTLLLSDVHVKSAALANWIANMPSSRLKRVEFYSRGTNDSHSVDLVDIESTLGNHRVVCAVVDLLKEPLFKSIASGADDVFFILSGVKESEVAEIAAASFSKDGPLRLCDKVVVLSGSKAQVARDVLSERLAKLSIKAAFAESDPNDYTKVWQEISGVTTQKPPANMPVPEPAPRVEVDNRGASTHEPSPKIASKTLNSTHYGESQMANANETLAALMQIDGAVGCLIADYGTGMLLAKAGGGVNLDVAAAGNSEVIKSKMKTMSALGLKDSIEDILITLGTQYHILRPIPNKGSLFMYIVLDKAKSNLAMARFKLADIEKALAL